VVLALLGVGVGEVLVGEANAHPDLFTVVWVVSAACSWVLVSAVSLGRFLRGRGGLWTLDLIFLASCLFGPISAGVFVSGRVRRRTAHEIREAKLAVATSSASSYGRGRAWVAETAEAGRGRRAASRGGVMRLAVHLVLSFAYCFLLFGIWAAAAAYSTPGAVAVLMAIGVGCWALFAMLQGYWWWRGYERFWRPIYVWSLGAFVVAGTAFGALFLLLVPSFRRWIARTSGPHDL
jgi:hypothetical protein